MRFEIGISQNRGEIRKLESGLLEKILLRWNRSRWAV
nr:MAG TPA: hypothetical protein [Caudoviricetes sp.]